MNAKVIFITRSGSLLGCFWVSSESSVVYLVSGHALEKTRIMLLLSLLGCECHVLNRHNREHHLLVLIVAIMF